MDKTTENKTLTYNNIQRTTIHYHLHIHIHANATHRFTIEKRQFSDVIGLYRRGWPVKLLRSPECHCSFLFALHTESVTTVHTQ